MSTTTSAPTVLVVQNSPGGGPRRVGDWLAEAGLRLEVVYAVEQPLPGTLAHDAVMVMGGGYLPDEDDRAPWLPATRSLVGQALDAGRPVLGICLGGQLLAHVAGGVVESAVATENGSVPVRLRPDAETDALFGGLPAVVPAIEHHSDAVTTLPDGAVWLAETDRCPFQAFRVGEVAWGTQFHPEIGPDQVLRWDADKLRAQGYDRDELYAAAVADEPISTPVWREVVDRFATVVAGRALTGA